MEQDNEHDAVTRSNTTHNGKQFTSDRDAPIDPMKLPVHEITPRTALGSHLPFPMNVNAPQPSPPNRAFGEQAFEPLDAVSKVPRRRATLPSLILSPSEAATLNAMWDKEIESGAIGEELKKGRTPTPDIGRAITSAGGQAYKRRSRSADALNDLAREQQTIEQQTRAEEAGGNGRKAEIEYWRASLGAGVQTHDFQRQQEPLDRDKSPGSSSGSGRSMKTANLAQSGDEKGQPEMDEDDDDSILLHRRTPPNERASFEKPSPEDVRPPHPFERPTVQTQPATALYSHSRNFSRPVADSGEVEKLRENVEDRLSRLEFTVHKLENSNNRRTIILENAPQGRRSKAEDNSSSNESNHSRSQRLRHASNVQPALDFIQRNQDRSPSIADASSPMTPTVPANSQPMYNMYSGSTFSPNSSASHHPYQQQAPVPAVGSYNFAGSNSNVVPSSLPSPNIYDHLAPLYRALRYERSKRKEFATQLQSVHQQMAELNTMIRGSSSQQFDQTRANGYKEVHARGGPSNSYPTPSPNDAFRSSGSIPSNIAAEDGMGWKGQQSRFSGLEYDSSEDEYNHPYSRRHGRSRGAREYDAESGAEKEIYGTPKETMVSLQQSIEQTLPPAPPTPHAPVSSKIPTPKQSMKNLVQKQPSFSNSPVGTSSSSTVGTSKSSGSRRNRFGFKGGKG